MINRRTFLALFLFFCLAIGLFFFFFTIEKEVSDSPIEGHKIAQDLCSKCHAIGKVGDSPNKASPPFRVLANRYPMDQLEEAFGEGVIVGHVDMPTFELEPNRIADLLSYIGSLKAPAEATDTP